VANHRGEKAKAAKLTDRKVRRMRKLATEGVNPYELSRMFGVSRPHVKRILAREKWGWLE
jgi:hypothetical protein